MKRPAARSSVDRVARRVDSVISALSPAWSNARAQHRAAAAAANVLATSYDLAQQSLQRRQVTTKSRIAEHGAMTETDLHHRRDVAQATFRNNSIMSGFLKRGCDSVVGTGLTIVPQTSDGGLNAEMKAAWEQYYGKGGGWEVTGRFDGRMAQRMIYFSVVRDGDVLQYRSDDGWQFFEAQQMGTPWGYESGKLTIRKGVQVDAADRPERYWVGQYAKFGYIDFSSARGLRADKCRHIFSPEWFSGDRGLPVYHNCCNRFDDLDLYLEADLFGAMASACIVGEINSPHMNALDALGVKPAASKNAEKNGKRPTEMTPGTILHTFNQEKFHLHSPNRPNANMPDMVRLILRVLGFPIGLPLELALMDFTETNFAAAKMAVCEAAKTHLYWRDRIIQDQHLVPVYLDFLDHWMPQHTDIRIPATAKLVRNYAVLAPSTAWLDAYKEALAINEGIKGGWDTQTRAIREEMNRTVEDVFTERANEIILAKQIAKAKGISENWREILRYIVEFKEPPKEGQDAA